MKKVFKKGLVIVGIYLLAVASTLMVSNRVEELNSKEVSHDNNTSLLIRISK